MRTFSNTPNAEAIIRRAIEAAADVFTGPARGASEIVRRQLELAEKYTK